MEEKSDFRAQAQWCRTLARYQWGERPKAMLLAIAAEFDRLAELEESVEPAPAIHVIQTNPGETG